MGANVGVRAARPHDLDEIADLFLACWRTAYRDVLPKRVVGMYDPASARALWLVPLSDPSSQRTVLVAETAALRVVGVIAVGHDPDDPSMGHIFSLYVHPGSQGRGIGALLVSEAVERFHTECLLSVTLWVFEANAAARDFYERLGWQPDGATRVEPEYGELELRLQRALADRPTP